ncbi:hypothetical protein EJ05DRAFT_505308 [Pseudovirgaria hyperparasitica]|uniref:Meiotic recombination protein dmc1 n=1 Tax=Pseudovirgaria hyperparasitica TaxID=470096 RepID=A0A6A6VTJ9_9PEZI|nr:uncharacterized protein EJ05DRAFT_505308 [Pseudovirgaria hyperparasitica]KAF2753116.1 hypothetical protein EJ05DRAFT_505308 [Pseudovirgaria hyperparasitica]
MSSPIEGGFFKTQILSPPASSVHSSQAPYALPRPRSKPLRLGGSKESAVIRHIDDGILQIQRHFAQRSGNAADVDHLGGYTRFKEAGNDIEKLVDVVWVSGTPSLQVPYLLSLSLLAVDCISGLPVSPRTMFRLLHKLDVAFASLLQGQDIDTGESLPGSEGGRTVSDTQKVRLKGIVQRTRVAVVDVMSNGEIEEDDQEAIDMSEDVYDPSDAENPDVDLDSIGAEHVSWEMETAKVYDRTVVELGDTIGGPPIGIIVD